MDPEVPRDSHAEKEESGFFFALEIPLNFTDTQFLAKNPEKSSIWLSRKMMEKGREMSWSKMSLEEKKSYDVAEAKELSNVLSAKALRSLTLQEKLNLDPKTVMNMRWVLTKKSDGTSKARLVVLGFQAANIGEVQTAAPTMARVSRNLVLAVCANYGFRLKARDVTSAFLQAAESLEDEKMTIWAPAELAVLFGADPHHPVMPLRITKAFYGLVQAPRCWFNDVSATMRKHGWKNIVADRCIFCLYDDLTGELIAIAGIHVDDFLMGGNVAHPKYQKAEKDLLEAYK